MEGERLTQGEPLGSYYNSSDGMKARTVMMVMGAEVRHGDQKVSHEIRENLATDRVWREVKVRESEESVRR